MASANYARSLPDVFAEIVNQLGTLVHKEVRLARAEMSEKINFLFLGSAILVAGAVLLIPALVILLESAVTALAGTGLARVWCSLIVGGSAFLVGLLLMVAGAYWLRAVRLLPERTLEQLRQDAALAKRQMGMGRGATERAA